MHCVKLAKNAKKWNKNEPNIMLSINKNIGMPVYNFDTAQLKNICI